MSAPTEQPEDWGRPPSWAAGTGPANNEVTRASHRELMKHREHQAERERQEREARRPTPRPGPSLPPRLAFTDPDEEPTAPRRRRSREVASYEGLVGSRKEWLQADREARRELAEEDAQGLEPPPHHRLDDFLATEDPEVAFRIDRLLPVQANALLAASFKAGKTTLMMNLARALADGVPFLGRFEVAPPEGGVYVLDDELGEATSRAWFRRQAIRHPERVHVQPLRGRLSTFDITTDRVRALWAERIAETGKTFLVLDCLRPIIDALGLSEDKDAGIVLGAFEALLAEAGCSEGIVVHHMGHNGERSRGDSRLRDWPDVEWKLVREDPEQESSPRFFSAYGRDVDEPERRLVLAGAHLTVEDVSRKEAAVHDLKGAVLRSVTSQPGIGATELRTKVGANFSRVNETVAALVAEGLVRVEAGARNARCHYLTEKGEKHSEVRAFHDRFSIPSEKGTP